MGDAWFDGLLVAFGGDGRILDAQNFLAAVLLQ
jgi:hypothetical protein